MSSDCGMIFRLGRIAKLSPNLSWLGWIQSALVEVVAGLSDFFRLCSFTYWWPYDRFLNITLSFCCIVSFRVDKCTVRVYSFLSEGVAYTVKVSPILV